MFKFSPIFAFLENHPYSKDFLHLIFIFIAILLMLLKEVSFTVCSKWSVWELLVNRHNNFIDLYVLGRYPYG